jgi:RND family efflux transporter MFP subunit
MLTRNSLALALGVGATALACGHGHTEKAPARPVRVETVRSENAPTGLRYSATIQPHQQVSLAFKVGGYVREVRQVPGPDGQLRNLQQGDAVTRGMVLARLNASDYEERVRQAKAQVAEADAGVIKARADAARAESLYGAKALTRPDYDAASANLAAASARFEGARAQLESAQISLNDATLVAPEDGVILSRSIEVGALAGAGTVAFTLADLTRVKAVFGVPDLLVQRVQIGAPLQITSEAFGSAEFPGRVTAVSPSADAQSRVFNVEVTIPNARRQLKAGMIATVEVAASNAPDIPAGTPTVSVSAIVKSARPGAFAVFVAEGQGDKATARAREVSLGRISGNRVAVETGLKIGDPVVVSGASLLTDGDPVRVIPGSEGE